MPNENTIEFVSGEKSSALIRQLAKELDLPVDEVVQKGLTFMVLYAGLKRKNKHLLMEDENGELRELIL